MKTSVSLLLIALCFLVSFRHPQPADNPKIKKGMIKVAIFYPNGEGKTFDMDYYTTKHMPMAARLFGASLKAMAIDKGVAGGSPDTPLSYLAIGYFYFETLSACQQTMQAHSAQLRADVSNYTNIKPVVQISEVQLAE